MPESGILLFDALKTALSESHTSMSCLCFCASMISRGELHNPSMLLWICSIDYAIVSVFWFYQGDPCNVVLNSTVASVVACKPLRPPHPCLPSKRVYIALKRCVL